MAALTRKELAAGLEISPQMVGRLLRRGMPADSLNAAKAWREEHLSPAFRKDTNPARRPVEAATLATHAAPDDDAIARVHQLWPVARVAIGAGCFDLVEREMRAALAAVRPSRRAGVLLDRVVMDRLTQHVVDRVVAAEGAVAFGTLTEDEAEEMGRLWYEIAAGEHVRAGA